MTKIGDCYLDASRVSAVFIATDDGLRDKVTVRIDGINACFRPNEGETVIEALDRIAFTLMRMRPG